VVTREFGLAVRFAGRLGRDADLRQNVVAGNTSAVHLLRTACIAAGGLALLGRGKTIVIREPPTKPTHVLVWQGRDGLFKDFKARIRTEHGKGVKQGVAGVGVDPARKGAVREVANDLTTAGRRILGRWQHVDQDLTAAGRSLGLSRATASRVSGALSAAARLSSLGGAAAIAATAAARLVRAGAVAPIAGDRRAARAAFVEAAQRALEADGTIYGDPTFWTHDLVQVRGVEPALAGRWRVRKVTHDVSAGGYLCTFQVKRDGFSKRRRHAAQSAGQDNRQVATAEGQRPARTVVRVDARTGLEIEETR
jgi:hypothetical protein